MTHVVSALFGAMLALVIYTRLGGLATVLAAFGVLIAYILVELFRLYREQLEGRRRSDAARARMALWAREDRWPR